MQDFSRPPVRPADTVNAMLNCGYAQTVFVGSAVETIYLLMYTNYLVFSLTLLDEDPEDYGLIRTNRASLKRVLTHHRNAPANELKERSEVLRKKSRGL